MAKRYRVKGHPEHETSVLEGRIVLAVEDLFNAENPAAFIGERALDAATSLFELWEKHHESLEEIPESEILTEGVTH